MTVARQFVGTGRKFTQCRNRCVAAGHQEPFKLVGQPQSCIATIRFCLHFFFASLFLQALHLDRVFTEGFECACHLTDFVIRAYIDFHIRVASSELQKACGDLVQGTGNQISGEKD